MRDHVTILAVVFIGLSGISLLIAVVGLLFFGGVAGIVGIAAQHEPDARIAVPILGGIGLAIFTIATVLAVPGLVTGIGLLKLRSWARLLGVVLSALNLLNIPLGTLMGVYGLWVLLSPDTEQLFADASRRDRTPAD